MNSSRTHTAQPSSHKVVRGLRPEPRTLSMPLIAAALIAAAAVAAGVWYAANSGTSNVVAENTPVSDTAAVKSRAVTPSAARDQEVAGTAHIEWFTDFEGALAAARDEDRLLLIDFAASWCAPCQMMDKHVWPDQRVQKLMQEQAIPLRIDVDADQAKTLMQRYSVEFVPTILLVDAAGKEIAREGYLDADGIVDLIN